MQFKSLEAAPRFVQRLCLRCCMDAVFALMPFAGAFFFFLFRCLKMWLELASVSSTLQSGTNGECTGLHSQNCFHMHVFAWLQC